MNKNESTFIYHSSDGTKIKQIKISRKKIFITLAIMIAVVITSAKFSLDIILDLTQNSRIESLKKNNEFLKASLEEMNGIVSNITSQMEMIEHKDDELRMIRPDFVVDNIIGRSIN